MEFKMVKNEKINEGEYLYRYEDDGEQICEKKFKIVKGTYCGWWIDRWPYADKNLKFVYKTGKNNFAKKTRKEAMENYYHRKCLHVAILNSKLMSTRVLLNKAKTILEGESNE